MNQPTLSSNDRNWHIHRAKAHGWLLLSWSASNPAVPRNARNTVVESSYDSKERPTPESRRVTKQMFTGRADRPA